MADFLWQSILARPEIGTRFFSGSSIALLLDASALLLDRYRWSAADNQDWDAIEAAIAQAQGEIMTNPMIGVVLWRAGGIQANELMCDGTIYNRVDYPDLYDALDIEFIVDSDTFAVPDLVHKAAVGEGDGWQVGDTGGNETVTLTVDQMPEHFHENTPHSHTYFSPTFNIDVESVGIPDPTGVGNPQLPQSTSAESISIANAGGGQEHENMPPYLVLTPVIVAL
jgi:microcystin-dependent protein